MWDAKSGKKVHELVGHERWVLSIAYSPDGKRLATGGLDNTVRIRDAATGKQLDVLKGHTQPVPCIEYSPDGKLLASGSLLTRKKEPGELIVWNTATGKPHQTFKEEKGISRLAFLPDSAKIAYGYEESEGGIRIRDVQTGMEVAHMKEAMASGGLVVSPDGSRLVSNYNQNGTSLKKVWDLPSGKLSSLELPFPSYSHALTMSSDSRLLAESLWIRLRFYDFGVNQEVFPTLGHVAAISHLSISADGRRLLTHGSQDQTLRMWDSATGKEMPERKRAATQAWGGVFSPDGKQFATFRGKVKLVDSATGEETRTVEGDCKDLQVCVFRSDGKRLASGETGRVQIWDTVTGKVTTEIPCPPDAVWGLAYSPDGKLLAGAPGRSGSTSRGTRNILAGLPSILMERSWLPPTKGGKLLSGIPREDRRFID